jgi:hypothetical protein
MNKLLATLIVGALTSHAAAQTAAPSPNKTERQGNVQSATQMGDNSGNARATAAQRETNVKASKQVSKLSKAEKSQLAKDATKSNVNPENSSGAAATAVMQKQTTTVSRTTPKQNIELRTKEGKRQLDKDLQSRSTP